jgi:hypothetical protein
VKELVCYLFDRSGASIANVMQSLVGVPKTDDWDYLIGFHKRPESLIEIGHNQHHELRHELEQLLGQPIRWKCYIGETGRRIFTDVWPDTDDPDIEIEEG